MFWRDDSTFRPDPEREFAAFQDGVGPVPHPVAVDDEVAAGRLEVDWEV
ncbi:MAG: hypothetical protein FD129_3110, partial [bacterium]